MVTTCARRLAAWIHPGKAARRESAVLIRQVTTWRLERLGLKSLTAFHDLTNAFGSVKWEAMDRAAASLLGTNCLLGQQRYKLATTTIPGKDGDVTLKNWGKWIDGRPSDSGSVLSGIPPVDDSLAACCGRRGGGAEPGQLLAWHPWSGGRIDFSLSQYADGTTKQIVAEPGEEVEAPAKRVRCSNDVFDRALATDGFSQNRWKEELLMHLVGEGSFADRRLVRDGKVSLPRKVEKKASFAHELPRRRQATMTAFYSVGQLWYESRVSWRLKRCFFIGRVVNTAPSGIDIFCFLKAQYQSLTSLVTCLARRVMAGAAARRGDHGRVRTMTKKEVLRFWKLAPCDVEARVRRLKCAQTLVQDAPHTIDHCHVCETAVRTYSYAGSWWRNITRGQSVGGAVDGSSGRIGVV